MRAEFEAGRADPRPPRGAPRGAGGVLWARALLRRVEAPMQRLAADGALSVPSAAAKAAVAAHNALTAALVQFETSWAAAAGDAAEAALAGLAAPLVVPVPDGDGRLEPGLDKRVLAAAADARWLARLGCAVPPRAAAAAHHEARLARLHASLTHALDTRAAALDDASPRAVALLAPHAAAFDASVATRGGRLTWSSAGAAAFVADVDAKARALAATAAALEHALEADLDGGVARVRGVALLPTVGGEGATPVTPADFEAAAVEWAGRAGQQLVDG